MSNKESILIAATNLFNKHGTAKVSTNHIAKEAGISPGNLYYHYKDKSHIIREIYERMIKEWDPSYQRAESQEISLNVLKRFITDNFELLWRYRFFNREIAALLNADAALAERHFTVINARFAQQRLILQPLLHFPESGIQLNEALTIVWIIANHYLIHLEYMGQQVEQKDFSDGAELVLKFFHPYLK